MIVEQIRYFLSDTERVHVLEARRTIDRLRQEAGVPSGTILIADEDDDGPDLIWQCGYEDEGQLGMAEAVLLGNPDYEKARADLAALVSKAELGIYIADDQS